MLIDPMLLKSRCIIDHNVIPAGTVFLFTIVHDFYAKK
nr:MAG TPA: hypothetical protein [Caudoviricetes sp.]